MTTYVRSVELDEAPPVAGTDGRTVSVRVVSWNTDYRVSDDGRRFYTERYVPGGLNMRSGTELVATSEHDPRMLHADVKPRSAGFDGRTGVPVGRIAQTHIRADGLYADVRVFDSLDGDGFLRYVRTLERSGRSLFVSAEFDDEPHAPADVVERVDATLIGIAFTLTPQYSDARVLAVRSQPNTDGEAMTDDNVADDNEVAGTDTPDPARDDTTGQHSTEDRAPVTAGARSQPAPARTTPRPGTGGTSHFRSFGHYAQAVANGLLGDKDDPRRQRFARALDVAETGDVTGLVGEAWLPEVIDLYKTLTPTIQAFRSGSLPDSGLVVNVPVVGVRPTVLAQVEGEEIESTKATIVPATWNVGTYAGGQGTSLQAIMRTDPSYLDALMRLYVRELAIAVNKASALALLAAADTVNTTDIEYTTPGAFDTLLIDASAIFLSTMHRPVEVVGFSIDLWEALASAKDTAGDFPLYPSINPFNRQGSMNATDPEGNIVGIDWYVEPAFGARGSGIKGVAGVRDAWLTLTSPVHTLTADNPTYLTRDTAVFQFAAFGATDATGLIEIANAT